jgi:hypothetical protein
VFYERHPWVLQVAGSRAVLGPHELDVYEEQLRLLDGLGLDGVDLVRAVSAVAGFVRGSAKAVSDARTAERATGLSDDDWWNIRSPILEELTAEVDWAERYPVASRLESEEAFAQPDRAPGDTTPYTVREALDAFEAGLRWLLDGLETHVAERHGPSDRPVADPPADPPEPS